MSENAMQPVLALVGRQVLSSRDLIERELTANWDIRSWVPGMPDDQLVSLVETADALLCGYDVTDSPIVMQALRHAQRLKLLQIPFAGFEWLDMDALPGGCVVCNASGHEFAMAEYVMAGLLEWENRLTTIDRTFRTGDWLHGGFGRDAPFRGELHGKTLGIVGFGTIGREVARKAAAFDMRVIAVGRSERERPMELAWYGTVARLSDLLRESDYVVVACSLNDQTEGLLNGERLHELKPEAVLVNVARGTVVDEAALFDALQAKRIAGAILDVWYLYPPLGGVGERPRQMPSRFPFQDLDNVLMTPHCSARTHGTAARRWSMVIDNLNRFSSGRDVRNVVMRT